MGHGFTPEILEFLPQTELQVTARSVTQGQITVTEGGYHRDTGKSIVTQGPVSV